MTILCALYDPEAGDVWLGCNDKATIGDTPSPAASTKWLTFGDWAIGLSGDSVYEQYLQLVGEGFPEHSANVLDIFKFLRETFDEYGLGRQKEGDCATSYSVDGLIVNRSGRIWDFDHQLALSEVPAGRLWACGSGVDYALGADFAMNGAGKSAQERVTYAVGAAIALDISCPGAALVGKFAGQL